MLRGSTPIFAVADVERTIAFYRDVLGFTSSWTYGEPVNFGSASLDGLQIMFALQPELAARVEGHMHWVACEDVDAAYAMHRERGAEIVEAIADRPWGAREYVVRDPNGYHLRFGGSPASEAEQSTQGPLEVQIERRVPTVSEHLGVHGGGKPDGVAETLSRTWRGWVATDVATGEPVGVTRAMLDGPGWVSIWDVHVREDVRGRGVGTALMRAALADLAVECPAANVYLFTYKDGFYERLGFKKQGVLMRQA